MCGVFSGFSTSQFYTLGRVSSDRPADRKEAFNITEPCNEQRVSFETS